MTESSGPWAAGTDQADAVFRRTVERVLVRRDVRRRLAGPPRLDAAGLAAALERRRDPLLSAVSEAESSYRELLADARAGADDDPGYAGLWAAVAVWLALASGPVWPLVSGATAPSPTGLGLTIALVLFLLVAPPWVLAGGSRRIGTGILTALVAFVSFGSSIMFVLEDLFGTADLAKGTWYPAAGVMGAFLLPAAVGGIFGLAGKAVDRMRTGPRTTWAEVAEAFEAWSAELHGRTLAEAEALLTIARARAEAKPPPAPLTTLAERLGRALRRRPSK